MNNNLFIKSKQNINSDGAQVSKYSVAETFKRLINACKNGNLSMVQYLAEEDKVDISQKGSMQTNRGNRLMTALHAAVIAGQVNVVHYLLENDRRNINVKTELNPRYVDEGSTALHLAVLFLSGEKQTEIVRCLLNHGADWAITNYAGKQCWELATSINLTKLFLQYGVGLDSTRNPTSSTFAHKWAASLHKQACEIIALMMIQGVRINEPNANGLTPIMIAAIGEEGIPNLRVFEQLLNQGVQPMSKLNQINALELVGASLIFYSQFELGLKFWREAMKYRFEIKDQPHIPKPVTELSDMARIAFNDVEEFRTVEELEKLLVTDHTSLEVQAQLVYIRILGLKNDKTLSCLETFAHKLKRPDKQQEFFNYTNFILQNCDATGTYFFKEFIGFVQGWIGDLAVQSYSSPIKFASIFKSTIGILERMLVLLKNSSKDSYHFDILLTFIVNVTYTLLRKPLNAQETADFYSYLCRAIYMQKRNSLGKDLLLLACSPHFQKSSLNKFTQEKVISTFLELGADPNSKDDRGESAIHILSRSSKSCPSIRLFYEAGVPLGQVNFKGETIAKILSDYDIPFELTGVPISVIKDRL